MRATSPADNNYINLSHPDDILRWVPIMKIIIMHFSPAYSTFIFLNSK